MIESSVTLWAIATFVCNYALVRLAQTHDISPDHTGVVDLPCADVNHPEQLRYCETMHLSIDPGLKEVLESCMCMLHDLIEVCS